MEPVLSEAREHRHLTAEAIPDTLVIASPALREEAIPCEDHHTPLSLVMTTPGKKTKLFTWKKLKMIFILSLKKPKSLRRRPIHPMGPYLR